MTSFAHLARILLTGALVGLVLAAPAEPAAAAEPTMTAADPCSASFAASPEPGLQLATDPRRGSDVRPGDNVRLAATWTPGAWDALAAVRACVRVWDAVEPSLGAVEEPADDDGVFEHRFAVSEGLANGTVICGLIRLDGDPVGEATEGSWVSKTACFEVNPEEASSAPPPAAPAPAPAPTPAAKPTAPPPAPTAAEPAPPAAATPALGISPAASTSPLPTFDPGGAPAAVPLPELPRTGSPLRVLAATALFALAAGLPLRHLGRTRT